MRINYPEHVELEGREISFYSKKARVELLYLPHWFINSTSQAVDTVSAFLRQVIVRAVGCAC